MRSLSIRVFQLPRSADHAARRRRVEYAGEFRHLSELARVRCTGWRASDRWHEIAEAVACGGGCDAAFFNRLPEAERVDLPLEVIVAASRARRVLALFQAEPDLHDLLKVLPLRVAGAFAALVLLNRPKAIELLTAYLIGKAELNRTAVRMAHAARDRLADC